MNCDGKCFLATKLKEEQERQENTPAFTFNQDFGIYIQASLKSFQYLKNVTEPIAHVSFYPNWFVKTLSKEIDHPPKG